MKGEKDEEFIGTNTLAQYSNSANLKARPKELKRIETKAQASQKANKRSSSLLF